MPRPPLHELKPQYLELIDLIRDCRMTELGKKGLIRVPKEAVDSIAAEHKIKRYLRQLNEEGILGPVEGAEDPRLPFVLVEEDGEKDYILNCQKTAEEILDYKKSLAGAHDGSRRPLFTANSWENIKIRFTGTHEVVVITPDDGQRPVDYEALGFKNLKTGNYNMAWGFLLLLARHGGQVPSRAGGMDDSVRKQKAALSKTLKQVFGLNDDPFYPPREEGGYKIRIELTPPVSETE